MRLGLVSWLGLVGWAGCHHPSVTAVALDQNLCGPECGTLWGFVHHHCLKKKEEGIPFYLPKPLLIVAKNFRSIEDPKVGLTDSAPIPDAFDDQAKYADLNARTSFNFGGGGSATGGDVPGRATTQAGSLTSPTDPGTTKAPPASTASKSDAYAYSQNPPNVTPLGVPGDGLAPNTLFTYQIVFVPDMTQKYGLKVSGGVGEIRAAMNLVNGWQFTGLGPYYMKDSSTAQDVMASGIAMRLGGQAVQDVLKGVTGLARPGGGTQSGVLNANAPQVQQLARALGELPRDRFPLMTLPAFAEIHVFEARLGPDGQMEWCEVVNLAFNRDYLGSDATTATLAPPQGAAVGSATGTGGGATQAGALGGGAGQGATAEGAAVDPEVARMAVAGALGLPVNSPAISVLPAGGTQSGALTTPAGVPAAGVHQQVQVTGPAKPAHEFNLFRFGGPGAHHAAKRRGLFTSRTAAIDPDVAPAGTGRSGPPVIPNESRPPGSIGSPGT